MNEVKITDLTLISTIADTDVLPIVDLSDGETKKTTASQIRTYAQGTLPTQIGTLANLTTTEKTNLVGAINEVDGHTDTNTSDITNLKSGWNTISITLAYSSADAPTFVISTPSSLVGIVGVGDRIRLTQTTVKYFIVTAITASTITVYGGTDYTLANATITSPSYSHMKSPVGFPMNPNKWTVSYTDTTQRGQASPTVGTWYNLGSLSTNLPIGGWDVNYKIWGYFARASTGANSLFTCISTTNNSASNAKYVTSAAGYGTGVASFGFTSVRCVPITVTTKTTFYFNCMTLDSATNIFFNNNESALLFEAVCAYL